jgi:hypothetical protein
LLNYIKKFARVDVKTTLRIILNLQVIPENVVELKFANKQQKSTAHCKKEMLDISCKIIIKESYLLLKLQKMPVEVLLQPFISIVNAKLLKPVLLHYIYKVIFFS